MQFEHIGIMVRPRNSYEAIDLGIHLVRQQWYSLYKIWFIFLLPLAGSLHLLFYGQQWIASLIIWWLKPLLDRIVLHFLSRALFQQSLSAKEMLKILPLLLKETRLGFALTIWRFDLARSFNLAVLQLERLRGKARRQRIKLLQKKTRGAAVWLTTAFIHFEWVLYLSLFGIFYLMLPTTYDINFFEFMFSSHYELLEIVKVIFNLIVLSIIEPFYVSCGFMLYLNRRIHLEGWDIELAFRQIATRAHAEIVN